MSKKERWGKIFEAVSNDLKDPISLEIMMDPVLTADGHYYERKNIERWFANGHNTSPRTGLRLSDLTLKPCHLMTSIASTVASLVEDCKYGALVDEQLLAREEEHRSKFESLTHRTERAESEQAALKDRLAIVQNQNKQLLAKEEEHRSKLKSLTHRTERAESEQAALKDRLAIGLLTSNDFMDLFGFDNPKQNPKKNIKQNPQQITKKYEDKEDIVKELFKKSKKQSTKNTRRTTNNATQEGISLIVLAMKEHPKHEGTQEKACDELRKFAIRNDDNKSLIAQKGGIPLIVQAMKEHPKHEGIQENACGALENLSLAIRNDNKILFLDIAKEGAIPLIIQAIKEHPKHEGIQWNACGALRNLAIRNDNKSLIAKEGAIPLILQAMKEHPKHEGVQEKACEALRNLAIRNDDNKSLIAQEGGIPLIVQAMKEHPYSRTQSCVTRFRPVYVMYVQWYACGALRNLAVNDDNKILIAKEGAIPLILQAMKDYPKHEGIQENACGALENI